MGAKKYSAYSKKKVYSDQEKNEFREKAKAQMDNFVRSAAKDVVRLISENKTAEWQKGWKTNPAYGLPKNPVTGHVYTRTNLLLLTLAMMGNDWQDARFCSFAQAKKVGEDTHVMKGGKSVTVLRPVVVNKDDADDEEKVEEFIENKDSQGDSENNKKKIVFFQPYSLFHASQIKNMPDPDDCFEPIDWENNNVIELLTESVGVKIQSGGNMAAYSPSRDLIRMPDKKAFVDAAEYYGTLLHEFYHSTGHESRENRLEGHLSKTAAGIKERALEELRAELFSVMAARALGLPYNMENSAMYVADWNKKCDENPQQILAQAAKAAEMLHVVMQFIQGQQPDAKWFPEKSTWPERAQTLEGLVPTPKTDLEQFLDTVSTPFKSTTNASGEVIFSSPGGDLNNKDVDEGFRIKDILQEKFGDGVDVVVESQDEKVVVTIKDNSADLDLTNDLSLR